MNFTIRVAEKTERDFKAVLRLLIDHFVKEHQMGSLSANNKFSLEKVVSEIAIAIGCKTWIVEDLTGGIIGSLGLKLTQPWYSTQSYYGDLWFYVLPEWRNSRVGQALIKEVKQFASGIDSPVLLGIYNMDDTERKLKLLQKSGLKLVGGTFLVGA